MSTPVPGPELSPTAPAPGPTPGTGSGLARASSLPLILGIVAILLAGSALGVSVVSQAHTGPAGAAGAPGPAGAAGARGPNGVNGSQGAPGPGAVLNQTLIYGPGFVVNNTTCNHWPGAQVGITATHAGDLLVSATFYARMYHTSGTGDFGEFALGNTTLDCTTGQELSSTPSAAPSAVYQVTMTVTHLFTVPAAGKYTIYLNSISFGSDQLIIFNANIEGAFFPT